MPAEDIRPLKQSLQFSTNYTASNPILMDFQFLSPSVLFATFLFLFMALKIVKRSMVKLPPGPWPLPIIGNMHQLVVSPLTHHVLRDLSNKYGPLMYLRIGAVPTVVVSSAQVAEQVLKTNGIVFAERPYLLASRIVSYNSTNIIFSPYGAYLRQMRKICTMELLSPKRVQTFRSIREEEVFNLIKDISSNVGSPINLSKRVFSLIYGITSRAAFGKKTKYQDKFTSLVEEFLEVGSGFSIADMYPSIKMLQHVGGVRLKLERVHKEMDDILEIIVNEHRERNTTSSSGEEGVHQDLVDVLLKIQKQGGLEFPLTDNNIKAVISDIFSAGSETTATSVEWAMSEMLKNPQVMRRAQAEVRKVFGKKGNVDETGLDELEYLQAIIKENLRLHPSAPLLIPRESSEQCEINGYVVPAKTRVFVNAWAIARDPKYWPQAEKFIPERFLDSKIDYKGTDFEFIPFGAGRRVCPGISFGVPNTQLPLAQLLYHFDWKLPGGLKQEELDMTEAPNLTVRRKNDLCLIPVPYHPSPIE